MNKMYAYKIIMHTKKTMYICAQNKHYVFALNKKKYAHKSMEHILG